MDPEVAAELEHAGVDTTFKEYFAHVGIETDEEDCVVPAGEHVGVVSGQAAVRVRLKPPSQLFTGNAVPPAFPEGPTPEFEPFFATIEMTAADFCSIFGPEEDLEFDRIYRQLRKDPDAKGANPLLSYIQAAARLYMSLRPTSRAEYEGVLNRLAKSARTFSMGQSSTNYFDYAISRLLDGKGRKQLPASSVLGRVLGAGRRMLGLRAS